MMAWTRSQTDSELPDAVVRMYRESLDDDGLDFLRHGPRTAAERLAYAQRVHPEAYRAAEPAPASAQAAFVQRRIFDTQRYFVGPDRNLYRRGEAAAEPLHASIRRGFETAVPGFRTASLDEALAEAEMLGRSDGSMMLADDAGSEQLADASTQPTGWSPWHKAGPLRMKEIEAWTRRATPAEARAVDPQTREDALRHLSSRLIYGGAQDRREELGQALVEGLQLNEGLLEHQRAQDDAFIAWLQRDPAVAEYARRWPQLEQPDRELLLKRIVGQMGEIYGFETPDVKFNNFNPNVDQAGDNPQGTLGEFRAGSNELLVDQDLRAASALGTTVHEARHAYAWRLIRDYFNGSLQPTDPRYKLAELLALNYQFKIPPMPSFGSEANPYRAQPSEAYANRFEDERVEPIIKGILIQ